MSKILWTIALCILYLLLRKFGCIEKFDKWRNKKDERIDTYSLKKYWIYFVSIFSAFILLIMFEPNIIIKIPGNFVNVRVSLHLILSGIFIIFFICYLRKIKANKNNDDLSNTQNNVNEYRVWYLLTKNMSYCAIAILSTPILKTFIFSHFEENCWEMAVSVISIFITVEAFITLVRISKLLSGISVSFAVFTLFLLICLGWYSLKFWGVFTLLTTLITITFSNDFYYFIFKGNFDKEKENIDICSRNKLLVVKFMLPVFSILLYCSLAIKDWIFKENFCTNTESIGINRESIQSWIYMAFSKMFQLDPKTNVENDIYFKYIVQGTVVLFIIFILGVIIFAVLWLIFRDFLKLVENLFMGFTCSYKKVYNKTVSYKFDNKVGKTSPPNISKEKK